MFMSARSAMTLMHIAFLVRSSIAAEPVVLEEPGVRHTQTEIDIEDEVTLAKSTHAVGEEAPRSPVRRIPRAEGEETITDSIFVEVIIGAIGFTLTILMQRIFGAKSKAARGKVAPGARIGPPRGARDKASQMMGHEHTTASTVNGPCIDDSIQDPEDDDANDGKDADRTQKAEMRKLLASVTSVAKGRDITPLVLRTIAIIESKTGATMNSKQVTEALAQLLRACASSKCFNEALMAFDCLEERVGAGSNTLWSLLLYIAAESGGYERCQPFYARLIGDPGPSGRDFVNVVRAFAKRQDMAGLTTTLESMRAYEGAVQYNGTVSSEGASFDRVARNRALAACYKEGAVELAVAIAYTDVFNKPLDSVGYNTLITCFSRAGDYRRSFATFEEMEAKGVSPTEATFGSLLEACCGAKDVTRAMGYLAKIQSHGLKVNAVHCTTLIKALVAEKRLVEAEHLLDELSRDGEVHPDIIVFYTLLKAFTDNSDMRAALRVYESMARHGVKPDEFVFNALINGCANDGCVKVEHFNVLMERFLADGLKPTTTTLSIMLKTLSRCGAWDTAMGLLESAQTRFNARVETRLYVQLAQAAIKAGLKTKAMEIHDAMVATQGRRGQEGKAASRWLLRQCDIVRQ